MSQSLSKMWTHLIFSTKERYPFLADRAIREEMHAYLSSILRKHDCPTLLVGGVADHVHALFALSKNHSIAEVVYEVKRSSSKWIKTRGQKVAFHPSQMSYLKLQKWLCGSPVGKSAPKATFGLPIPI